MATLPEVVRTQAVQTDIDGGVPGAFVPDEALAAMPIPVDGEPIPLFVAAVKGCNMKCWYCTEHGEGRSSDRGRMSDEELMSTIGAAYESGVRTFRFTGGEPTLRPSLGNLMVATQALGEDVNIALTTNGTDLDRLMPTLEQLRNPSVFISVDTFDDMRGTTGQNGILLEKWLSPEIRASIERMPANVQTRINCVLTAANVDQIPKLIDYAIEQQIDLKIFELLLRDYFYAPGQTTEDAFTRQYMSVKQLIPMLAAKYGDTTGFKGTGGKGIPMSAFTVGKSRIIFFDSTGGSHYGEACNSCVFFPCQEGFYAMTLDSNGVLHPSGCPNTDTYVNIAKAGHDERVGAFAQMSARIGEATMRSDIPRILAQLTAEPTAE